jgi:hypothetical protein
MPALYSAWRYRGQCSARGPFRARNDDGGGARGHQRGEKTRVKTRSARVSLIIFWMPLCALFGLAVLSAPMPSVVAGEANPIQSVTLVGTFQADLGCPYNYDLSCTQAFLQDVNGDGIYELSTRQLPRGTYECRVVINERWTESYGEDGDLGGRDVVFDVTEDGSAVTFTYDSYTHVLSVKERVVQTESEATPCGSNQECTDKLGSGWECDSNVCVRTGGDDNTVFFCGFSSFLGNNHPALDILRRFRDEVLKKCTFGRRLIGLYYRNQHKVFSFLEKYPALKKCTVSLIESSAPVLEFFLDDSGRRSPERHR